MGGEKNQSVTMALGRAVGAEISHLGPEEARKEKETSSHMPPASPSLP